MNNLLGLFKGKAHGVRWLGSGFNKIKIMIWEEGYCSAEHKWKKVVNRKADSVVVLIKRWLSVACILVYINSPIQMTIHCANLKGLFASPFHYPPLFSLWVHGRRHFVSQSTNFSTTTMPLICPLAECEKESAAAATTTIIFIIIVVVIVHVTLNKRPAATRQIRCNFWLWHI